MTDEVEMSWRNKVLPFPEHKIDAIDHNRKDPLEIINNPPRKPNEKYDVYYRPGNDDEDFVYDVFLKAGNGKEVVVPANKYFVMGDNRDNSEDSRFWGFVPRDLVIGRAMFVYWSYDESAPTSEGVVGKIVDFFRNTRWTRTGTLVR